MKTIEIEENKLKKTLWKSYGYGFFCGATVMAIISLVVITIQIFSRSCN